MYGYCISTRKTIRYHNLTDLSYLSITPDFIFSSESIITFASLKYFPHLLYHLCGDGFPRAALFKQRHKISSRYELVTRKLKVPSELRQEEKPLFNDKGERAKVREMKQEKEKVAPMTAATSRYCFCFYGPSHHSIDIAKDDNFVFVRQTSSVYQQSFAEDSRTPSLT